MIQHEDCAEHVCLLVDSEDFVLSVDGIVDVGRVHGDHLGLNSCLSTTPSVTRRSKGFGYPVGQWEGNVQVLSHKQVRQLVECAVDVGVAGVPTALGKVDPTTQLERFLNRLIANLYLPGEREILFAALERDRVLSCRQVNDEGMGSERRV